jgi:glutaredoxin 3
MFCNRAKEFLRSRGVSFEERDVSRDEAALEDLRRLGAMTTPVLVIDGETVVGFDRERIEELLAV